MALARTYTTKEPTTLNYAIPKAKQNLVTNAEIKTTPGYVTDYIVETRLVKPEIPQKAAALTNDYAEVGYVNQESIFVDSVSSWIRNTSDSEKVAFVQEAAKYTGYIDSQCTPLGKRGETRISQESWVV